MTTFWQTHQVGGPYETAEDSALALLARDSLYPDLVDLMPTCQPDKVVLDYGCGPGHDTLLFLRQGAKHVYYVDASELALEITDQRLALHDLEWNATGMWDTDPFPYVNHVHCAGVLHHMEDPLGALHRFRAALRDGEARIMVYDGELSTHSQSEVPITEWWTPTEFLALAAEAGFVGEHVGSYPCSAGGGR